MAYSSSIVTTSSAEFLLSEYSEQDDQTQPTVQKKKARYPCTIINADM